MWVSSFTSTTRPTLISSLPNDSSKETIGILNFEPRQMGPVVSEVLILGVQYPKGESGEATFVSPSLNAKIGSKLF